MKHYFRLLAVVMLSIGLTNCTQAKKQISNMEDKTIIEVTTFKLNAEADQSKFALRDAGVESDFTSKQPGFIKRQSGIDDQGNYVVIVYWKSVADANASMSKFMADASVADYAQMIDGSSMKMSRFTIDKPFDASKSQFVEVMSFDVKPETDLASFEDTNYKVETDFTGMRKGFLQRLIGVNEEGRQVVVVYWLSKQLSDASIEAFMAAPIAQEFMSHMDQTSVVMGRYSLLK